MMVYQWHEGSRIGKVAAQVAGESLEATRQRNDGVLTPEGVVEDARPDDAPLHPCFEWDDETAAGLFRESQARDIIRSLRIVKIDDEPTPVPIRAYVHIDEHDVHGRCYVRAQDAMLDQDMREQVLAQALTELRAWQARYKELRELKQVFEAIAQLR